MEKTPYGKNGKQKYKLHKNWGGVTEKKKKKRDKRKARKYKVHSYSCSPQNTTEQ